MELIELLREIHEEYTRYYIANEETAVSFDVWAWDNQDELNGLSWKNIHEQYGSWDNAVNILEI